MWIEVRGGFVNLDHVAWARPVVADRMGDYGGVVVAEQVRLQLTGGGEVTVEGADANRVRYCLEGLSLRDRRRLNDLVHQEINLRDGIPPEGMDMHAAV